MTRIARSLWRILTVRPLLTVVIALTVGGGLAAATIAFAVVDNVLLEPLPYANADRLVTIWETARGDVRNVVSPANYLTWRDELKSFDGMGTVLEVSATLGGEQEPERVGMVLANASIFGLVGATPLVGRLYSDAEDVEGGPKVVVLGEAIWRRRFGADPRVVGQSVQINGRSAEIIGVLPARFDLAPRYGNGRVGSRDLWAPTQLPASARNFGGRYLQVLARLAPGATVAAAQQEASLLASRLRTTFPDRMTGWDVNVVPLSVEIVGDVRTTVWIVFGAVCLVLLIACANVANLLLSRAAERRQEMAVRAALGAGRRTLIRQLLVESLVLVGVGAVVGIALAIWGTAGLVALAPDLPRIANVGIDPGAVVFCSLAALITALLVGVGPALELSRPGAGGWLTQRGAIGHRGGARLRRGLVGVQVVLSFVLLVGSGLLVRSLLNRLSVDLGLDPDGLVTGQVSLTGPGYADAERRAATFEQFADRAASVPGVTSAGLISFVPLSGNGQATGFHAMDRPMTKATEAVADVRFVDHRYHATMGIPLLEGRRFESTDRKGSPITVLINATGARLLWPKGSAVGQRIVMEWGDTLHAEIVGVVGDVRLQSPDDPVDRTTLYWNYLQMGDRLPGQMTLVARSPNGEAVVPGLRSQLKAIDPAVPLYNVRTMAGLVNERVARARFSTVALGLFAMLAMGLAVLGVYGVVAHATQQRSREIGIRLALGADRRRVMAMVLRDGGTIILPGLIVGLLLSVGLAQLLRSMVFEVAPQDPLTLAVVALGLGGAAIGACWLPARRAGRIDPTESIRSDA